MPGKYLEQVAKRDQTVNLLFNFIGARLNFARDGESGISMPVTGNLSQGGKMVAGGILATLADEAMAHAVLSLLPEGHFAVTAEMNIRYLRSSSPDDAEELTARAKVLKNGRALCFAEASVIDGQDRLLATAGATFYVVRPEKKEER